MKPITKIQYQLSKKETVGQALDFIFSKEFIQLSNPLSLEYVHIEIGFVCDDINYVKVIDLGIEKKRLVSFQYGGYSINPYTKIDPLNRQVAPLKQFLIELKKEFQQDFEHLPVNMLKVTLLK